MHRFHLDLPDNLIKAVVSCKNNREVRLIGLEWIIQQSKALKAVNVSVLHYYAM